ncbi:hypothetical protein DM860_004897 [Cuscuta australis]|uniref:Uncharacterized protein n=1 Tax=Cuscuta australis TaxID=267555 RepID=A0A328DPM0_9ASTE|nr:hypothetical protein DM860_004897 [Cuscuta australis]
MSSPWKHTSEIDPTWRFRKKYDCVALKDQLRVSSAKKVKGKRMKGVAADLRWIEFPTDVCLIIDY